MGRLVIGTRRRFDFDITVCMRCNEAPSWASAMLIRYEIPIKTVSEANIQCHWAVRARRKKQQRAIAFLCTHAAIERYYAQLSGFKRMKITMTRHGKRRMDSDNLAISLKYALKSVRDSIAQALGVNDGDERIEWKCSQVIDKTYSVTVDIKVN